MRIVRDPFVNFPSTTLNQIREEVKMLAERLLRRNDLPTLGVDITENLQNFLFPRMKIR